ncbi:uncharacterized protein BDZ99DRAFT_425517 [Mytilinidion resinicola]|uniref:Rhodopsin domain-containing protein n=1 Tax=Mytilinidion resinicola TaxID=574789 RepID=A0A6A6Y7T5_9PEZI|nr:uncharacterized protein BDZ99DRAFT_425517 [Mytilinidion resinicola]KAF2804669.1 hypothetical protein BDZ99DRAFT_425517 [Mytilinidion resinicola]
MSTSEYIPVFNRSETILSTTLVFLVIAWIAVFLRLFVRLRIPNSLGWDDLFVCFAISSCTAGSVIVCLQPGAGMGKHMKTLPLDKLEQYFSYVFAANVTYCSSTTLIKIAILQQYLRLFEGASNLVRRICYVLIAVTGAWGISFSLVALLGCHPIRANWEAKYFLDPKLNAKHCIAFGSKDAGTIFRTFAGHASSNMFLDVLVLLTPMPFLKTLKMQGKTRWGIIALFAIGAIVTLFSIARLAALATTRAGTWPVFDVTWYAPPIFIFSSLEVEVAILCASIPIFWPLVASLSFGKILVVNEISVHSAPRDSILLELGRRGGSVRSSDGDVKSEGFHLGRGRRLSDGSEGKGELLESTESQSQGERERYYADRYVAGLVAPDWGNGEDVRKKGAHTTTVERAEMPFDHINAMQDK